MSNLVYFFVLTVFFLSSSTEANTENPNVANYLWGIVKNTGRGLQDAIIGLTCPECESQNPQEKEQEVIPGTNLCKYSWEEKKGYTDYSNYNGWLGTPYSGTRVGIDKSEIMQEREDLPKSFCERAMLLRPCFEKVLAKDTKDNVSLKSWSRSKGYDPALVLLAIAQKETMLGLKPDTCTPKVNCNGTGIMQISTPIGDDRKRIPISDNAAWEGITYNMQTNIKHGIRIFNEKINISKSKFNLNPSFSQVAYNYNGHPKHQTQYSKDVPRYYNQLKQWVINGRCP